MLHTYAIDPAKTSDAGPDGTIWAMVEMLVLMAYHHRASRLEFWTADGVLRISETINEQAHEFPEAPDSFRQPVMNHLRKVFGDPEGETYSEASLHVGASTARARCDISDDNRRATVTILSDFDPVPDLHTVFDRFWRKRATDQGITGWYTARKMRPLRSRGAR